MRHYTRFQAGLEGLQIRNPIALDFHCFAAAERYARRGPGWWEITGQSRGKSRWRPPGAGYLPIAGQKLSRAAISGRAAAPPPPSSTVT